LGGAYEGYFLFSGELFDSIFSSCRLGSGIWWLGSDEGDWSFGFGIAGSFGAMVMFLHSSFHISRDASVEGAIGALQDVGVSRIFYFYHGMSL